MLKANRGGLLVSALVLAGVSLPARADTPVVPACAVFQSCGQWATFSEGGYNLFNNIWGDGAGPQCLWACSHGTFGVWADHPASGGVKAYANSEYPSIGARITAMASLTSTFDATVPDAGAYTTAYDIWSGRKVEIMLWMNKLGAHEPWARQYDANGTPIPEVANVTVGGHTWNAYWNGGARGFNVFSMVRTSNTNAGTVDIKACLTWLKDNLGLGDVTIDKVQLGFEILAVARRLELHHERLRRLVHVRQHVAPGGADEPRGDGRQRHLGRPRMDGHLEQRERLQDRARHRRGELFRDRHGGRQRRQLHGRRSDDRHALLLSRPRLQCRRQLCLHERGQRDAAAARERHRPQRQLLRQFRSTNLKLTRTDATINFNWGNGAPDATIAPDSFSARWTGFIQPLFSETYTIETYSDDGDRVWVNGQQLVNDWKAQHGAGTNSGTIALTAGVKYAITVEFMENSGGAGVQLYWSSPSQQRQIVPQTQLFTQ